MDVKTLSGFDAAKFRKLAQMFDTPFSEEADKLLDLTLKELRQDHNRFCDDRFGLDRSPAKTAAQDEYHAVRYGLKKGFVRFARHEVSALELDELIDRLKERCAEIERDTEDVADAGPAPVAAPPDPFADFAIPDAPPPVVPLSPPAVEPESAEDENDLPRTLGEWVVRVIVALVVWIVATVGILFIPFYFFPSFSDSLERWLENWDVWLGIALGFGLLWLLRKLLPKWGFVGLSLKIALFINGLFVCYVIGFHETPWNFLGGAPFPALARPVWPFVIACVLAGGVFVIPEATEWFRARSSRLRLVFLFTVAVVVITVFVLRARH